MPVQKLVPWVGSGPFYLVSAEIECVYTWYKQSGATVGAEHSSDPGESKTLKSHR